jgi:hypothetical protein
MTTKKSSWELLSKIDVSQHVEKKNNLTYLSWAWAWGILKNEYPNATFTKHHSPQTGMPYFVDHNGFCFVRVTVELGEGEPTITEFLPVLDHRNKAIQNPDSFSVNNALQRCLTKAIAYLGLGHYIYAGEDLPQDAAEAPEKPYKPVAAVAQPVAVTAPVAAVSGSPNIIVTKPDGAVTGNDGPDAVAEVFRVFIPECVEMASLQKFYAQNKVAIAYLSANNKKLHEEVMGAFAARKQELK